MASIKTIHDADALLLYRVGPVYCCSPTMQVVSVQLPPKLSHPPGSHAAEPGMFRAGSGMVRVVDLRKRFGVDESDWQDPGRLVVVEVEGGQAGFWVDEIIDVIQYPKSGWGQAPLLVPREVFSRTLMLNDQINLYADFENLNRIRETGYLRQHIQHLKQQQARVATAASSAPLTQQQKPASTDTSARFASNDQSVRSRSDAQADQLPSDSIRQDDAPGPFEPVRVDDSETSNESPPTPAHSGASPPLSQPESRPLSTAEASDGPATRPVSTRPIPTHPASRNPARAAATAASATGPLPSTGRGLPPARSSRSPSEHRPTDATHTAFSESSTPTMTPAVAASTAPQADRDRLDSVPPAGDGDTRAMLVFAALMVLLLAGGGYFIHDLWQDDGSERRPIVDQPVMHEAPPVPEQAESLPAIPVPIEEPPADNVASVPAGASQLVSEDLPAEPAVQLDEPIEESPMGSIQFTEEDLQEQAIFRADINSDEEGLVIVLNTPSADAESVLREDASVTTVATDEDAKNDTVIDTAVSGVEAQQVTTDEPLMQATDSGIAADSASEPAIEAEEPVEDAEASMQSDGEDAMHTAPEQSAPEQSAPEQSAPEKKSSARPRTQPRVIIHRVVKGDTLWHIARRYINDPFRYPELARLSRIKNPDLIYPGDKVKIIVNASN